ncbi:MULTISPECIES: metallophosphoesterase [unclassified Meiothermus]|uniref:metallophosphoesterase family protein n=1 Tax=unclassified Meiothermus TaxID=370471 RepID=UPI000D7CA451|nr:MULTISPECIES: metallophosphoesterase [unclassified Meiothermus]PZA07822.1 acid phosphatase [Meiothermus sp. Pnk-1]RYM38875.1 acid phosphatase [Meiothermus sp. PNK-Is4]
MPLRVLWFLAILLELAFAQRIGVIGDWGAESPHRLQIAQALHQKGPLEALLTLGDNFYPRGEPVQRFVDELPRVKIYPAFGNHDVPALEQQLRLFGVGQPYYTVQLGQAEIFIVYSEAFTPQQRAWLERALQTSQAPWKVVALHRPLYSSGFHGGSRSLRQSLEPLLVRYGVQLVLAGHDHDYERLEARGIVHLVAGGGGAYLRGFRSAVPESKVRRVSANFLVLEATSNKLTVTAYGQSGEVLDRVELGK